MLALTISGISASYSATLITATPPSGPAPYTLQDLTIGDLFTVGSSDLSVTNLGMFVNTPTQVVTGATEVVSLWSYGSGGTLGAQLAQVTFTAGTSTAGDVNNFLYQSLPSTVTLSANTNYLIGEYFASNNPSVASGGDQFFDLSSPIALSPDVSATVSGFYFAGITGTPSYQGSNGYVAANFQYELAVVPEPQIWAMFLGGFGVLMGLQRFRRGQQGT